MATERLTFESDSGEVAPELIRLERIDGRAELSRPYEYALELSVTEAGGLAPEMIDDLLRRPCRVHYLIEADHGVIEAEHVIHGVLRRIRTASVSDIERFTYHAELVPTLWRLSLVTRSRVFMDRDVSAIVREVLAEHGIREGETLEVRLRSSYPPSEYTVQYQESDLAFINRLMEHVGIFYTFVQDTDRERLIITDGNDALDQYAEEPLAYDVVGEGAYRHGTVQTLERTVQAGPATVLLRDYNWRTPHTDLSSQGLADNVTGYGFTNFYGEHYKDPGQGGQLATVRGQEISCRREVYESSVMALGLWPGHRFELFGHLLGEYDRRYFVTSVELCTDREGVAAGGGVQQRISAIPVDVPYRPPRRTEKPRIDGIMHGHIDGPTPGTAAPIDELGRYKVIMPFDLAVSAERQGGKASRWIRMAQPSSGPGYGMHLPQHIGAEVAIAHLRGDPDRPVIIGSVHNTTTVNHITSNNPTQAGIRTQAGIVLTFDDDC